MLSIQRREGLPIIHESPHERKILVLGTSQIRGLLFQTTRHQPKTRTSPILGSLDLPLPPPPLPNRQEKPVGEEAGPATPLPWAAVDVGRERDGRVQPE